MSTPTTGQGWIPEDTFAARLLLARRHLGLGVKEAAERCHIHYATWSTWERGATPQNYRDVVLRVAEGLGVNRDWLAWGGELSAVPTTSDQVNYVTKRYDLSRLVEHSTRRDGFSIRHMGVVHPLNSHIRLIGNSRTRLCHKIAS